MYRYSFSMVLPYYTGIVILSSTIVPQTIHTMAKTWQTIGNIATARIESDNMAARIETDVANHNDWLKL